MLWIWLIVAIVTATAVTWLLFAPGIKDAQKRGDQAVVEMGIVCGAYVWLVFVVLGSLPPLFLLMDAG